MEKTDSDIIDQKINCVQSLVKQSNQVILHIFIIDLYNYVLQMPRNIYFHFLISPFLVGLLYAVFKIKSFDQHVVTVTIVFILVTAISNRVIPFFMLMRKQKLLMRNYLKLQNPHEQNKERCELALLDFFRDVWLKIVMMWPLNHLALNRYKAKIINELGKKEFELETLIVQTFAREEIDRIGTFTELDIRNAILTKDVKKMQDFVKETYFYLLRANENPAILDKIGKDCPLQEATSQSTGQKKSTTKTNKGSKPSCSDKTLLEAALLEHHKFGSDHMNYTPATQAKIAKILKWKQDKVSRVIKRHWGSEGWKKYLYKCESPGLLEGFLAKFEGGYEPEASYYRPLHPTQKEERYSTDG